MHCPHCGFDQEKSDACPACGLVFAKYAQRQERLQQAEASVVQPASGGGGKVWLLIGVALITGLAAGGMLRGRKASAPEVAGIEVPKEQGPESLVGESFAPAAFPDLEAERAAVPAERAAVLAISNPIEQARNATVFIRTPWGSGSGFLSMVRGASSPTVTWWSLTRSNWTNCAAKSASLRRR